MKKTSNKASSDLMTMELKKGFEWTTHHTRIVAVVVGLFFVGGLGYSGWKFWSERTEKNLQAQYFDLELKLTQKKESFSSGQDEAAKTAAARAAAMKAGGKSAKVPADDEKSQKPTASGDLSKDYGELVDSLNQFATQNTGHSAGALAALSVANLYDEYKKPEEGVAVLRKIQVGGVIGTLVRMELATLLANSGKCGEALPLFEQLIKEPKSSFLKLEARNKSALCYEAEGKHSEAEAALNKVLEEGKESSEARSAERYLRLLQLKKTEASPATSSEVKRN